MIFVWPWNENVRAKQKQQTNRNRVIWLVYRTDTNAHGFWLVKQMPGNFLQINRYLALMSYCNAIGRKILKISCGAYIFQRPFLRGLSMEGYLHFKIDWASLIVGSKFTILALFYSVFEGNFPRTSPPGAYIWRGDLTEGFLRYRFGGLIFGGLIHGGAYFRNLTVPWLPKTKTF